MSGGNAKEVSPVAQGAAAVTDHTGSVYLPTNVTGLSSRKSFPIQNVQFVDGVSRLGIGLVLYQVLQPDAEGAAGAEAFFADCVRTVHSVQGASKHVRGGRTQGMDGFKRSEAPMESMRQTLKARGAHEAALMFKQGWNGLQSLVWWMTGAMFLYLRTQFMPGHVDNPHDKHAVFGDEEFDTDHNYKANCHLQALSRVLLKSSEPGRASMLLLQDGEHSDGWTVYCFYGLVAVIASGPMFDLLGHAMIGCAHECAWSSTFVIDFFGGEALAWAMGLKQALQSRRGQEDVSLKVTARDALCHRQLHETLWAFFKGWRKNARARWPSQDTLSVFGKGGATVLCFTGEGPALAGIPVTLCHTTRNDVAAFDINLLQGQVPWYVLLGVPLGKSRKSQDYSWDCRVVVKWNLRQAWEAFTKKALRKNKCELKDLQFGIQLKEHAGGAVLRTVPLGLHPGHACVGFCSAAEFETGLARLRVAVGAIDFNALPNHPLLRRIIDHEASQTPKNTACCTVTDVLDESHPTHLQLKLAQEAVAEQEKQILLRDAEARRLGEAVAKLQQDLAQGIVRHEHFEGQLRDCREKLEDARRLNDESTLEKDVAVRALNHHQELALYDARVAADALQDQRDVTQCSTAQNQLLQDRIDALEAAVAATNKDRVHLDELVAQTRSDLYDMIDVASCAAAESEQQRVDSEAAAKQATKRANVLTTECARLHRMDDQIAGMLPAVRECLILLLHKTKIAKCELSSSSLRVLRGLERTSATAVLNNFFNRNDLGLLRRKHKLVCVMLLVGCVIYVLCSSTHTGKHTLQYTLTQSWCDRVRRSTESSIPPHCSKSSPTTPFCHLYYLL